jgi:DNA polymerase-3 subunit gamma/tau
MRLKSGVVPIHVSDDLRPRLEEQAAGFSPRALARAVRLFNRAAAEAKGGWQPQLPLEMALIEAALPPQPERPDPQAPSTQGTMRPRPSTHRSTSPPARSQSTAARPASPSSPTPSSPPAEAVQEPASTYSEPAPGDGSLTSEILRSRWPEFLNALRPHNLSLEALMRSCEPVAVEGDVVLLGFAHNFHRSKVEEEHNKRLVEDVLSGLVGWQCQVRCILADQERAAASQPRPSSEAASGKDAASKEQMIAEDPVVRTAVEDLGAQIVRRSE